eukprot:jgi/Galph1/5456/GphlegSOOS_G4023.1
MTSRFFATGDTSSSESETDYSAQNGDGYSDESRESSDIESREGDEEGVQGGPRLAKYLRDTDSEEEEEERRVVRSAKTKQQEAFIAIIQQLKNHVKISDWISIQSDLEGLNRHLSKSYKIDVFTDKKNQIPKAYTSTIVFLEEFLNKTAENKEKKLSKTNTKAFNAVKQRLKKITRELEEEMKKFRESGAVPGEDLFEDDEEGSEADEGSQKSTESLEVSEEESASEGEEWEGVGDEKLKKANVKSKWLMKTGIKDKSLATKERRKDKTRGYQLSQGVKEYETGTMPLHKDFIIPEDLSETAVEQKLLEIIAARGRKGTSRKESLLQLEMLMKAAKNVAQEIEILFQIVSTQFDMIVPSVGYLSADIWRSCATRIENLLELACKHQKDVQFLANSGTSDWFESNISLMGGGEKTTEASIVATDGNALLEKDSSTTTDNRKVVRGDLATILEHLDDDLFRAWQGIDAYLPEYVDRLKDEFTLMKLLARAQEYFESQKELDRAARIACRRIQHLYYKPDELLIGMIESSLSHHKTTDGHKKESEEEIHKRDPVLCGLVYPTALNEEEEEISSAHHLLPVPLLESHQRPLKGERALLVLAVVVYRYGSEQLKTNTILCQIYHHALENRYYEARDMMLMSHLQESVQHLELPLQILFNRAMAQLGLCAFRLGFVQETHTCLQDLCTPVHTGLGSSTVARLKELLAQGVVQQRGHEKSMEQERMERTYQIPYHMHLPVDFIELAHLVSAMLLEIPNLTRAEAKNEAPQKRKIISRAFQHFLRNSIKQVYPSPPENTRDYVMAASRALIRGNWKDCYRNISLIRAWESVDVSIAQTTLSLWKEVIKVESLRTFVLSYSSHFDAMRVSSLAESFELASSRVHSVISKMIMNEELQASWDQPSGCIITRRVEPNRLQTLALQLAEKCTPLVEQNERLLDARAGGQSLKAEEKEEFLKSASGWIHQSNNNRNANRSETWNRQRNW